MSSNIEFIKYCLDNEKLNDNLLSCFFVAAYKEDKINAINTMFFIRDFKVGLGRRYEFRLLLKELEGLDCDVLKKIIPLIVKHGRWDDVLHFNSFELKNYVFSLIREELLIKNNSLCAKWMPRKGVVAKEIYNFLGFNEKKWRGILVSLSDTVEQKISKRYNKLSLDNVGNLARQKYSKYFRFAVYSTKKEKEKEIKCFNFVKYIRYNKEVDFKCEIKSNVLPIVDVSSSLNCDLGMKSYEKLFTSSLNVATSINILLSNSLKNSFKNCVVNFNERPEIKFIDGNLNQRVKKFLDLEWGKKIELETVFDLLMKFAEINSVSSDKFPDKILLITDNSYEESIVKNCDFDVLSLEYEKLGYSLPKVIFWRINSKSEFFIKENKNCILINGFHEFIVDLLFGNKEISYDSFFDCVKRSDRFKELNKILIGSPIN